MVVLDLPSKLVSDLSRCWKYDNGDSALLVFSSRRTILHCLAICDIPDTKTENTAGYCSSLIVSCYMHPPLYVDHPDQRPELFRSLHVYKDRWNLYWQYVSNSAIHEISIYKKILYRFNTITRRIEFCFLFYQ